MILLGKEPAPSLWLLLWPPSESQNPKSLSRKSSSMAQVRLYIIHEHYPVFDVDPTTLIISCFRTSGSAGLGITHQILDAIVETDGLKREDAAKLFYLVDKNGLITESVAKAHPLVRILNVWWAYTRRSVTN